MSNLLTKHSLWIFTSIFSLTILLGSMDASAMGSSGFLKRMKSKDGCCLCNRKHQDTEEVSDTDSVNDQTAVESNTDEVEKMERGGIFARLRSRRSGKEVVIDAEEMTQKSSSDAPVEAIPPAPKS